MGFEPISSAWKADNLALDLCPRMSYLLLGKPMCFQSVAQLVACSVWDRVVAGSSPVTLNPEDPFFPYRRSAFFRFFFV